jgi:hypothetical protein
MGVRGLPATASSAWMTSVWGRAMKSRGPERVCFVVALLAFSIIAYIVTPPAILKQATAFLGFD